jgi:hypothetical protein
MANTKEDSWIYPASLLAAVATGCAFFALLIWKTHTDVEAQIASAAANAAIFSSPSLWPELGRSLVYDVCYNGCGNLGCPYANYVQDACSVTTQFTPPEGVICKFILLP